MPEIVFQGKASVYHHHLTLPVGGLALVWQAQSGMGDLAFDGDWRGTLNARQFQPAVIS